MKRKTKFKLKVLSDQSHSGEIDIVGEASKDCAPYLRVGISKDNGEREFVCATIEGDDLKKLATNILKAFSE